MTDAKTRSFLFQRRWIYGLRVEISPPNTTTSCLANNLMTANVMSGRMNPNASQFCPSALAMVQHIGAVKESDFENCPRDMIIHESLKHLIQEVQELKGRTAYIEEENGHLTRKNEKLELELSSLKKASANGSAAPAVQANLTGYAASDISSSGRSDAGSGEL